MKMKLLRFVPSLLCIALVIENTEVKPSIDDLFESLLNTVTNDSNIRSDMLTPGAGLERLSPVVLEMLQLIEDNELDTYAISQRLRQDGYVMQRITESAWPIKRTPESPFIFYLIEESPLDSGGSKLTEGKEVLLVYSGAL
ncbi:MAG: hypothetical protein GY922_01220 [Proteobacteria bacterium]|nr:hypothetical protein [Pseudomonadota bacterium]